MIFLCFLWKCKKKKYPESPLDGGRDEQRGELRPADHGRLSDQFIFSPRGWISYFRIGADDFLYWVSQKHALIFLTSVECRTLGCLSHQFQFLRKQVNICFALIQWKSLFLLCSESLGLTQNSKSIHSTIYLLLWFSCFNVTGWTVYYRKSVLNLLK